MARQMEALAEADRKRRKFKTCSSNNESGDEVDDESEDEFDDDNDYPTITAGTSRYRNDFIEMGVLGRGGGGEVVKVRNRLDRRLYAVKKIELESEVGKFASVAAIQNKKLRREVTTISRMLHKNIVRYYQAWVEGGEEVDAPSVEEDGRRGGRECTTELSQMMTTTSLPKTKPMTRDGGQTLQQMASVSICSHVAVVLVTSRNTLRKVLVGSPRTMIRLK